MSETMLNVNGMSCPSCVRHLDGVLKRVTGVEQVEVRLREGQVRIRHGANANIAAMIAAIEEAGYPARQAD